MTLESQHASNGVTYLTDDVPAGKNTWRAGSLTSLGHQIGFNVGGGWGGSGEGCGGPQGRGGLDCGLQKEPPFDRLNYRPIILKKRGERIKVMQMEKKRSSCGGEGRGGVSEKRSSAGRKAKLTKLRAGGVEMQSRQWRTSGNEGRTRCV